MFCFKVVAVTLLLLATGDCLKIHNKKPLKENASSIPSFKTFWTTQQLDHFNFRDDRTFQHRYLLNGTEFIFIDMKARIDT